MNERKFYPQVYINYLNNLITKDFKHLSPIQENFSLTLQGISRLVMLDRYSQKDKELKTLQIGDIVITTIKYDPRFSNRGIGKIISCFTNESNNHF